MDGLDGVFEDREAVGADIAVGYADNRVEAVSVDFGGEFLEARFVEFKGKDFATGAWEGRVGGGVAIENCSSGRVGEGPTASSSFDEDAAGADSEALEDVAVVWGVDYLRPVRERHGPCFWRRGKQMDESGRSHHDFFPSGIFGATVGIFIDILGRIGFQLPLLTWTERRIGLGLILSFPSSRARINGRSADLRAPWDSDEGAVGEGAEAGVCYFAFGVAFVLVIGGAQNNGD